LLRKGGAEYLASKRINRHTAYQLLGGRRNLPLSIYLEVAGKLPQKIRLKMAKNLSAEILLPLRMNAQVAYLAGAMRDGWLICVKDRPIGIGLAQNDQTWLSTARYWPFISTNFWKCPCMGRRVGQCHPQ